MKKTTPVFLPCLVLCALLAGCGKQSQETLTEKLIEKSLSRDGVAAKVDLSGGTMKFTSTDAEGRKSDVVIGGDAVKVFTEEGTATYSSGENVTIPADFPKDVFRYPEAKPLAAMSSAGTFMLNLKTSDALEKVGQRYKSEMTAAGWKEVSAFTSAESWMVNFGKDKREVGVILGKEDESTTIMINVVPRSSDE